jgi:hypothetical protein
MRQVVLEFNSGILTEYFANTVRFHGEISSEYYNKLIDRLANLGYDIIERHV